VITGGTVSRIWAECVAALFGWLIADHLSDIDQVVGDHSEANPALHPIVTAISASIETVSALAHTDAPLASHTPSLPVADHRFICSRLRATLLLLRLGMQTRFTPLAFAAASFLAE